MFCHYRSPSHIQNFWTHFRPRSGFEQRISFGWQLSPKVNRNRFLIIISFKTHFTSSTFCDLPKKKKKKNKQWLNTWMFDSDEKQKILTSTFITVVTTIIFTIEKRWTRNTFAITASGFINTATTCWSDSRSSYEKQIDILQNRFSSKKTYRQHRD